MTISPPFKELFGFGSVPDNVSVTFPPHQPAAPVVPEQPAATAAVALPACFCTLTPIVVLYSQDVCVLTDLFAPANDEHDVTDGGVIPSGAFEPDMSQNCPSVLAGDAVSSTHWT